MRDHAKFSRDEESSEGFTLTLDHLAWLKIAGRMDCTCEIAKFCSGINRDERESLV